MAKHAFLFLLLLSLFSCITPYDPSIEFAIPKLVVEGQITDDPGPYQVRVTYSAAFNNDESIFGRYPENAEVFISDSEGNMEQLSYQGAGKYLTNRNGMRGTAGRFYTLRIVLQEGQVYESLPELLSPVPPIDTLYKEYRRLDEGFLRGEFDILIDSTDPPGPNNYYKWEFTHYSKEAYCRYGLVRKEFRDVYPCCQDCWHTDTCYGCINISNDHLINGNTITRRHITTIPYDTKEPYFLLVKQISLSENMYNFWKAAKQIIHNSGGVFDKPPITVRGNIFNKADSGEQVLGYFAASSVYSLPVFIRRDQVGETPFGTNIPLRVSNICIDCEESPISTRSKPPGWDSAIYH